MSDSGRGEHKQKHWWTTPLGWVVTIMGVFAAIPPGTYVTGHLQPWAAPIVWAALAVGALACVGYFTSKVNGWLVCGVAGFMLSLAFGISMVEGWGAQVQAAINVARIAVVIGSAGLVIWTIVFSVRLSRRVYAPMRDGLREIGEQIHTDALFRDDGERIVVYPRRWRLLRLIAGQTLFAVACALGIWWAVTNDANPLVLVGIGCVLVLIAVMLPLNLARLVMRGPTLVIGPDGVLDRGSQIVTGRGLLRWDELIGVMEYTFKTNMLSPTYHWLMIVLTDATAVRDRQPFIKRTLGFLGHSQVPSSIAFTSALINQPPRELAEQIKRYARSHAPAGWDSPLIAEDNEEYEDDGKDKVENDAL